MTYHELQCVKPAQAAALLGVTANELPRMLPLIRLRPTNIVRYQLKDIKERWDELRPGACFETEIKPALEANRKIARRETLEPTRFTQRGTYKIPIFAHTGQVYFVADAHRIKIGYAKSPLKRIESMKTASSSPLRLLARAPGSYSLERWIHDRFKKLRDHGEWFHPDPELVRFIRAVSSWKYPALKEYSNG